MSFEKKQQIFTKVLTNDILTINETMGITVVAINLIAGVGSYTGTKNLGAVASSAIPLSINDPVTISAEQSKYIDLLTIDASAGTCEIIAR